MKLNYYNYIKPQKKFTVCILFIALCSSILFSSGCGLNKEVISTSFESANSGLFSSVATFSEAASIPISVTPTIIPASIVTPTNNSINIDYGTVSVPVDFTPGIPDGFKLVSEAQKQVWMPTLTLFHESAKSTMFLWIDSAKITVSDTNGLLEGKSVDSSVSTGDKTNIEHVGFLIAVDQSANKYKAEMLHVNLIYNGDKGKLVPVKNTQKSDFLLSQQLRMINSRVPITKEEINNVLKLQTFDPSPYGEASKSPFNMRSVCIDPFLSMLHQADHDGIASITVRDTYRGYDQQNNLFQGVINYYISNGYTYRSAYLRTATETAIPGTSEHHDGYTADIITKNVSMNQAFGGTTFGLWIAAHCWNYGFILRYLPDKETQTTKKYEPWHVRYVGVPTAKLIKKYGIVLEEFHAYLLQNQYILWSCNDTVLKTASENSDYIYIRCSTRNDLMIPVDCASSSSTLISEDGTGSIVFLYEFVTTD